MTSRRTNGYKIGGLVLLGLVIAGGVWAYPELRRFHLMHSM